MGGGGRDGGKTDFHPVGDRSFVTYVRGDETRESHDRTSNGVDNLK